MELADTGLSMAVSLCEQLGGNSVLHGKIADGQPIVVLTVGQSQVKRGDVIRVRLRSAACLAFDRAGKVIGQGGTSPFRVTIYQSGDIDRTAEMPPDS